MVDLLAQIDALARIKLAMRRNGYVVCSVRGASDELRELAAFAGLDDVLRFEPRRQPVQREERVGVEEERALDDPPA